MSTERSVAHEPEDLTRLFVERANAGDAEALAALYEEDAVLGFPPGEETVGRRAIQRVLQQMLAHGPDRFEQETPNPTLRTGDIALTSTPSRDGTGTRVQIVRRQADGTWLRLIDRPESRA